MSKVEHDIDIQVVDNGFIVVIGTKSFVFSELDSLDNWIEEHFKTPEISNETIRKTKHVPQEFIYGNSPIYQSITNDELVSYDTSNTLKGHI